MMQNRKKTLILGVCGSIAAYKAADLCSQLVKADFDVHVILTAHAQKFIGAATFLSLSRNPVVTDLFEVPDWKPGHIALSECANALIIVPATANILAKMAHGIADDALSTQYLSVKCPTLVAPAMNTTMYLHAATQENLAVLRHRNVKIIEPVSGMLACGTTGMGHLAPLENIIQMIKETVL